MAAAGSGVPGVMPSTAVYSTRPGVPGGSRDVGRVAVDALDQAAGLDRRPGRVGQRDRLADVDVGDLAVVRRPVAGARGRARARAGPGPAPGTCGSPCPGCRRSVSVFCGVTLVVEQELVDLLARDGEVELVAVRVRRAARVGRRVPLVVADQGQRLLGRVVGDLVRDRSTAACWRTSAGSAGLVGRDRAVGRERAPVGHVRERLGHRDGEGRCRRRRSSRAARPGRCRGPCSRRRPRSTPGSRSRATRGTSRGPWTDSMPNLTSSAVTGRAVLVLHAVADRERPLGEVLVGRAEVGGQVGHQDRLPPSSMTYWVSER